MAGTWTAAVAGNALLIGRAFGQSPQSWINLQAVYDLKIAEQEIRSQLLAMRPLAHAGNRRLAENLSGITTMPR